MKLIMLVMFMGVLATSCNNASDNNTSTTIDSTNITPALGDTTVTDPLTRTDSTQKSDSIK
ncbi:MAG: hypothetical protein QM768_18155 [Agriterribacter sp.]